MLLIPCTIDPAPVAHPMLNLFILVAMLGILISLGAGLVFLVRDRGKTERTVRSLSVRVAFSVLLLALLAYGFASRYLI